MRVGRNASAKEQDQQAIILAVRAYVRHAGTEYDSCLAGGYERQHARELVTHVMEYVLSRLKKRTDLEEKRMTKAEIVGSP
jgi:hypothetical protein